MILKSTIVDENDLGIAPDNFSADPISRTAIGKGKLGNVHFIWPAVNRVTSLTLYYDKITLEQAKMLVSALAPPTIHNKVIQFERDGAMYSIPGKVGIDLQVQGGYVNLTVQTVTQMILSEQS